MTVFFMIASLCSRISTLAGVRLADEPLQVGDKMVIAISSGRGIVRIMLRPEVNTLRAELAKIRWW